MKTLIFNSVTLKKTNSALNECPILSPINTTVHSCSSMGLIVPGDEDIRIIEENIELLLPRRSLFLQFSYG